METPKFPIFLKCGNAMKSDICFIFAKNHGWPRNWKGVASAKLGACALSVGTSLKPPLRTTFSDHCILHRPGWQIKSNLQPGHVSIKLAEMLKLPYSCFHVTTISHQPAMQSATSDVYKLTDGDMLGLLSKGDRQQSRLIANNIQFTSSKRPANVQQTSSKLDGTPPPRLSPQLITCYFSNYTRPPS